MLSHSISLGIAHLRQAFLPALVLLVLFVLAHLPFEGKRALHPVKLACQYLYLVWLLEILLVTGIFDIDWRNLRSVVAGSAFHHSFIFLEDGLSTQTVLNVLLFVPYGFLAPLALRHVRWNLLLIALLGFVTSGAIESIQLFVGRFAQIEDLLTNTTGAVLGYAAFKLARLTFGLHGRPKA